jgi:hypothetical protein
VLHTWGSAMTHHPHVHMIVPGGGISLDGLRWIIKRPDFLLPVRVLSKLFRRLMIDKLMAAHTAGRLTFHGVHAALVTPKAFAAYLAPLKRTRWYVHAKRPLAGPKAVLAYLSRYTHRVAISNRRLIAADAKTVTFNVKDYIGGLKADATNITRQAVGVVGHHLDGIGAIGLKDADRTRRADTVAVQEDHDLPHYLLFAPGLGDAFGAHRADTGYLMQTIRFSLDHVEHVGAKCPDKSWRRPGRCRGSSRIRGTSRCPRSSSVRRCAGSES